MSKIDWSVVEKILVEISREKIIKIVSKIERKVEKLVKIQFETIKKSLKSCKNHLKILRYGLNFRKIVEI